MANALQTPPLVVFADDWGRHPSSCQHLVRRLRDDFRVLWVNSIGTRQVRADSLTFRRALEKFESWRKGVTQVSERMWVVDLPMLPGLGNRLLRTLNRHVVASRLNGILSRLKIHQPIVLTTLPYVNWLIRDISRRGLVYYCTDDYSHWPSADRSTLQKADLELSREADLVLAASRSLFHRHESSRRCCYFPHGVDFDHFAGAQHVQELPRELATVPGPRIGFFGLIYEKLNFELLGVIARHFSQASLVMIGPVAYCPSEFAKLPNVHLLGQRPYHELPRYVAGLDVLLLPYVDDPMIRQSGPLKLRECLASGKPTVSIDVPEVRSLRPHVRIGTSQGEFLDHVRQALAESKDRELSNARQGAVQNDSWDLRAGILRKELALLQPGRPPYKNQLSTGNGGRKLPRVLHLRTVSSKGGGPEKTLLNSPRHLSGAYQLRLAYVRPENDPEYDMPQRARQLGVDLVDIPEQSGLDPRTIWHLAREIEKFRPQILHAHDYKTNVLSVVLGRWFHIPVMTTLHGYVSRGGRLEAYYCVDRLALRRMDHIVTVSEDLYEFATALGVPRSRCSLVENAIDTEQYARRFSVSEAKRKVGINPARLVVGAIGRLSSEKGFDLLIRSAHQLVASGLDVEVLIAGEGPARSKLEYLISELKLTERVRLLGYCSDPVGLYEAMDVFALTSLREGLPNVILEAMALEVPVVATSVGGVPKLIDCDTNGLLIPPGTQESLTDALMRMLGDEDLRYRLSKVARASIERDYSFSRRMQSIRAIYDRLLTSQGHAQS